MISTAEGVSDFDKLCREKLSGEVHGNLAGNR
jgi:hypothetical protein